MRFHNLLSTMLSRQSDACDYSTDNFGFNVEYSHLNNSMSCVLRHKNQIFNGTNTQTHTHIRNTPIVKPFILKFYMLNKATTHQWKIWEPEAKYIGQNTVKCLIGHKNWLTLLSNWKWWPMCTTTNRPFHSNYVWSKIDDWTVQFTRGK